MREKILQLILNEFVIHLYFKSDLCVFDCTQVERNKRRSMKLESERLKGLLI